MDSVHLCDINWPENAEENDVETSIGSEERGRPQNLREKPF